MPDEERKLDRYRAKRAFAETPEPAGGPEERDPSVAGPKAGVDRPRFVVQEHHARRLHWDLRLEHDGVAVSWAIPNGIPRTPKENRLAVHTEDHPLEYLEWEGQIPAGQYGAGTMRVWDAGTYETHKFDQKKVEISFHGDRLQGRYGLFPIGRGEQDADQWMIHRMDPAADGWTPMPEQLKPMLARPGQLPGDQQRWSFEVKWDGVRAIAYCRPGRLRLESRNGNEITDGYPEIRELLDQLGMRDVVLDGELVAFDERGRPSFGRLQERMHVREARQVARLRKSVPVVYAVFDLLYIEGESLLALPYEERRRRLVELELSGTAYRVPEASVGNGEALLEWTRAQGLEGIIAKRLDSRYDPGARNGAWLKLKHTSRQELVIGGWLPGEGGRSGRIGALLVGYYEGDAFVYAGRVGTGFTDKTLRELQQRLAPLQRPASPFTRAPKLPRGAVFAQPELVCEVEFVEWTADGVMRAPSFKGLREDKPAAEVIREGGDPAVSAGAESRAGRAVATGRRALGDGTASFAGRELKISNYDKVLFPQTGFTKGELIEYYAAVAPAVLPHLRDRALTLKRYPNGVDAPHFYEKNSPSHRPAWVPTATIGGVAYTLCQEPATLVWLANLADIELHTSLALAEDPERPTLLVFDLDPGAPAGLLECCQVALVLRGLFAALKLESVVKTSGSKGMQVYVPLNPDEVTYEDTKPFARQIAELLESRLPELVVSRMTKRLREGRVLVDWSQNDAHKTTATVYSVRALAAPGVSTPLRWDEVSDCMEAGDAELLSFSCGQVLERIERDGDLFAAAAGLRQSLPSL
jgi:bifunctional non-homologous end joining protein LigD